MIAAAKEIDQQVLNIVSVLLDHEPTNKQED
jgi:hypothetical protein